MHCRIVEGRVRMYIGRPFKFLYDQLMHVLPMSLQKDEVLKKLTVSMDFTVGADGEVSDIIVSSDQGPSRLKALMQNVLVRATFRPRMVDGEPVETKHVKLVESFDPS